MKFGVNSDGTVSIGIKHNLGESKFKLPHAVQHIFRKAAEKVAPEKDVEKKDVEKIGKDFTDTPKSTHTKHELNLILIMIAATAAAWLLFRFEMF